MVGYPVSCEGETGMNFMGKPGVDGGLAITTKNSTQIGSGEQGLGVVWWGKCQVGKQLDLRGLRGLF